MMSLPVTASVGCCSRRIQEATKADVRQLDDPVKEARKHVAAVVIAARARSDHRDD